MLTPKTFRLLCLSLAVTAIGLSAVSAQAGPPGTWTQVTGIGGGVQAGDEIGLERTGDGRLHVAWTRTPGGGVFHSALSTDARTTSGPNLIIAPSRGVNNRVDLVAGPGGGLRVFFLRPLGIGLQRPNGHLWVIWARERRIYAGRTSPRGTAVGRVMTMTPPRGTMVIRNLAGEASRGPLDLFALVDRGARGSGYWHPRLLPPLAVRVTRSVFPRVVVASWRA